MFYKIRQQYRMRGWEKMAWVLVRRPENSYKTLTAEEFQVLVLCDGRTKLSGACMTDEMQQILKELIEEGIVELCEKEDPLAEEQYYRYYDNRFVRSAFWSITGRCNCRCRHCFMDAPEGRLGELSHEQAVNLIEQMEECGILRVDITGGEPFVRKDFWELIDCIQEHGMAVRDVYTNGRLLTGSVLDEFEKRNLKPEFSISFDGTGWHDWMRGVRGAEEAALEALRLCQRRGFPTNIEMCVHKGNQDTLRETIKLLSDIGVRAVKVIKVAHTDAWKLNNEGNEMDSREYLEAMLRYIPQFFEDKMPVEVMLSNVIVLHKGAKEYEIPSVKHDGTERCLDRLLCGAARYDCYITPEGRLLPCMPMTACREQELFPLIQEVGLKRGLSDSFYMDFVDSRIRDLLNVNVKCNACEHKYQCGGGCRANALAQSGSLMGCDKEQCFFWEEGYEERIRKISDKAIERYCSV